MKEKVEVLWPLGRSQLQKQSLAPRLDTLEGKTICGLFNWAYHFDETWPLIKQLLSKKYRGIKFVDWENFGYFFGKEEMSQLEALPGKLKEYGCDAVISGRGC